jgi:hypothetical protein
VRFSSLSPFSPVPLLNCGLDMYVTFPPLPPARTHSTLSTPFTYYPRTAPARAIPPRLEPRTVSPGLHISPEWRVHESPIAARLPGSPKGIICKVRFRRHLPSCAVIYVSRFGKGLHPRIARGVYAPRDPVPRYVYGTPSRPSNASHLYAIANGCSTSPCVFTNPAPPAD